MVASAKQQLWPGSVASALRWWRELGKRAEQGAPAGYADWAGCRKRLGEATATGRACVATPS
jgi:hypothetical protein